MTRNEAIELAIGYLKRIISVTQGWANVNEDYLIDFNRNNEIKNIINILESLKEKEEK